MRTFFSCVFLYLLTILSSGADNDEPRSFQIENTGRVTLVAPRDWESVERHHINSGTTFYRLLPPTTGRFDFELLVNDLAHMKMER